MSTYTVTANTTEYTASVGTIQYITVTTGIQGPQGPAGPGFAAGGDENQVLAKNSATDYDTKWLTLPSGSTDENVKISSNDTTAGYLDGKLVGSTNVVLTQTNDGGDETLVITLSGVSLTGHTHTASQVTIPVLGTPTYSTVEDYINITGSVGIISGCTITDNGDGTVAVSAGKCLIRATNSDVAQLLSINIAANAALALTNLRSNLIYIDYNAGSPIYTTSLTHLTDTNTHIEVGHVYRDGTVVHINGYFTHNINNGISKIIERTIAVDPFSRVSGGVISASGTRNIAITAGTWWYDLSEFTTAAFDSSVASAFTYVYRDGAGGWTYIPTQTQIDNIHWDDGTGTLATLGTAKYGVHWVYLETDNDVFVLYGRGDRNLNDALAAQPPADLPDHFPGHARLIGKIIIRESASTFTSIESVFKVTFTPSLVTDHGDLGGLADDDHTQYALVDGSRTFDIDNLTNVTVTTPATGEVLTYNSVSSKWENSAPTGGGASDVFDSIYLFMGA